VIECNFPHANPILFLPSIKILVVYRVEEWRIHVHMRLFSNVQIVRFPFALMAKPPDKTLPPVVTLAVDPKILLLPLVLLPN